VRFHRFTHLALFAGITINQFNQIAKDAENPQEAQSLGNEEVIEGQPAPSDSESTGQNTNACNATEYLQVTGVVVTEQYTNKYETRICNYTLSIQSIHPTDPIRYFY
jgi:hypothetical protein